MILKHEAVRTIYKSKYDDLTEIFILDPIVVCPPLFHMQTIVSIIRNGMENLVYKNNKMDCDDFALIMNAKIHLYRYTELSVSNTEPYQYSFGEVFVEKKGLLGGSNYHMMNSFIDEKMNLYFVEPQNGRIYKHGSQDDNVKNILHVRI